MSVATGNKGEKAKKFQSLNINNIYQVSVIFMKDGAELKCRLWKSTFSQTERTSEVAELSKIRQKT